VRLDNIVVALLLALIMLIGISFRYTGLNWDDFTQLHPDERFLNGVASNLNGGFWLIFRDPLSLTPEQQEQQTRCLERYPTTNGAGNGFAGYFDAECSTLNPHNASEGFGTFVYGTLPLFATRAAGETLNVLTGQNIWTSSFNLYTVWRFLSATYETLIILVVFCAGLRMHNKWVGLVAAALYAFTTLSIQQAHFGTADSMSNLFAALSILFAICVQRDGKLRDYAFFGIAFGCALASRVNLLPLVGLIFVAATLRAMPAFARGIPRSERDLILTQTVIGLIQAGIATLITFRLFNPYAFMGPNVIGIMPNEKWFEDISNARHFVSGDWDAPPNWQWTSRPRYIFALWNMVAWGMGIALGVVAWTAFVAALWRIVRGTPGALANVIPVAWIFAYFLFMGNQWVMTMRYYLPLYPALALMAGWGLVALVRYRAGSTKYKVQITKFSVPSSQFSVGSAQSPVVTAEPSVTNSGSETDSPELRPENYEPRTPNPEPEIENSSLVTRYSSLPSPNPEPRTRNNRLVRAFGWALLIGVVGFTLFWGLMYTNVYRNLSNRVAASYWFWEQVPGDFAMRIEGAPEGTPLINIALPNGAFPGDSYNLVGQATQINQQIPTQTHEFTAYGTGTVTEIYAPRLADLSDTPDEETLRFNILRVGDGETVGSATLVSDLPRTSHPLGTSYTIPLDTPMEVVEGERYRFEVTLVEGEAVASSGTITVWEGDWDDPLPFKTCTPTDGLHLMDNPPPGRFTAENCAGRDAYWALLGGGYKLQMVNNDSLVNRERMLQLLNDTDLILISSNRFYDSMTRNSARWPMTTRYYEALFSGELGFEPAAVFNRAFGIGSLQIPDNHLPFFDAPGWLNEWEAEEAFHVYDHPAVIIMRKTENYSPEVARAILESVPLEPTSAARPLLNCPDNLEAYYCDATLIGYDPTTSFDMSRTPTYLQMPAEARPLQDDGATWSERFDSSALINTQPILTVIVWWLAILIFGWVTFPLLFTIFPALADRGYALAKIAGILLVAWGTWYVAATLRAPVWNSGGILTALLLLALLSLLVMWRRRAEFVRFVRTRWRMLLGIEAITLVCFLVFLAVRLSNPDLWHFAFGGEKPMDFAYFNGVLRSSVFPAVDPWYAGGYINYYYFGFVIVGAPTLLLGVMPQIAYNLIIPTLFALTGIGAFAVAFSIVDALREWQHRGFVAGETARRIANPWMAGIAALVLAVVLGNLDTPRTFFSGVAQLGNYAPSSTMVEFLVREAEAAAAAGGAPVDYTAVEAAALNPSVTDNLRFELSNAGETLRAISAGMGALFSGQALPTAPHRWYWGPTRIIGENYDGNAIVEMPWFTFLYGDLHAHMIALPLQFLAMAFLLNEVLSARRGNRSRFAAFLALALGAITTGLLFATNSWDWITYVIFGMAGLAFAWWLAWRSISRRSLIALLLTLSGFFVIQHLASLPFSTWFANAYTGLRLWDSDKTPLWAFFSIHGTFLFLLTGLLLWDTGRWFRSVKLSSLQGKVPYLIAGAVLVLVILLAAFLAGTAFEYQAALVVVPLLLWVAVLFFRSGQSRAMQFVLACAGLSLGLMLGVEVVVLTGDIGRQNTIFKFYMQVWLLMSVVGGAAFAWLWSSAPRWSGFLRNSFAIIAAILFFIAGLYPIMSARGRALDRFSTDVPLTLNGMDYMNYASHGENGQFFPLAGDYEIIRWLQENVTRLPVIMEGQSSPNLYKWGSRIAINTGLPSVMGWDWHQTQQRALHNMGAFVRQRGSNVNAFYNTTDIDTALRIAAFYDVEYIIVGALERAYYSRTSLSKFDEMVRMGILEEVYRNGDDVIYRFVGGGAS
jgi:YYY domain-containing protein